MKQQIQTYTIGANTYLDNPEKWNRYLYKHKIWGMNGNRNITFLNEYMTTNKSLKEISIKYGLTRGTIHTIITRFLREVERSAGKGV